MSITQGPPCSPGVHPGRCWWGCHKGHAVQCTGCLDARLSRAEWWIHQCSSSMFNCQSLVNSLALLTQSKARWRSTQAWSPPKTWNLGAALALEWGVDLRVPIMSLTSRQWRATLQIASLEDLWSRKAQIGQHVMHGVACCIAVRISNPIMALPRGSWRAKGRRFWGMKLAFNGLGINTNHPLRHSSGIYGGEDDHQWPRMQCKMGARNCACCFHTTAGAKGLATAFPAGMAFSALSSCKTVKGTPGGPGEFQGNFWGGLPRCPWQTY